MDSSSASVVIPAHDEEAVIGRCLDALATQPGIADVEVLVVANGCSDRTVEVASAYADRLARLSVLEVPVASKVAALNSGDRAATSHPRIFLDADIALGAGTLPHLVDALSVDRPVVGAPRPHFDLAGAGWAVRRFYEVFVQLPYVAAGLTGLGVYGLSAAGRARFGAFPDLQADDLFVQRLFAPPERVTCEGTFTVRVPRTLRDLVAVRTRVARGNAALTGVGDDVLADQAAVDHPDAVDRGSSTRETVAALARLVLRRPRLLPGAVVYVGVTLAARRRAAASAGSAGSGWERDASSRSGEHDPRTGAA